MTKLLTRREIAGALGVHAMTVVKWLDRGLPCAERGSKGRPSRFDLAAVKRWRADQEARVRDGKVLDLVHERARLAKAQREKTEMQNRLMAGRLISREDAEGEWEAHARAAKARLLRIPRESVLRGIVPAEHEEVVLGLVAEALRELDRWRRRPARAREDTCCE